MSVQRGVSVPLGISTPNEPNIASTIWRTVSDQKNLVYYFYSATRPNTFWVSISKLDLKPGAPVKKLTLQNGEVFSGETADQFKDAAPFKFLPASSEEIGDSAIKGGQISAAVAAYYRDRYFATTAKNREDTQR